MASSNTSPISGKDYPASWSQFLDWFHTEEDCRHFLEKLKWPNGFICQKCGSFDQAKKTTRNRWFCLSCKHQTTVTAGTIFDKTRTELRVWFAAIWYITNQKHGVSALGLQRVLGLGSYETAWTMLHRLRRAMIRPDRELLAGIVEVDETYLDITDERDLLLDQGLKNNTSDIKVVIAVEIHEPKGFGRIRIRRIKKANQQTLTTFIEESISVGSVVRTDGSPVYKPLDHVESGYQHQRIIHAGSKIKAHVTMPGVHRVASLLQRWVLGTHHGAIKPKQLDYYLDEFVFRFNRRSSKSRGLLFYRLLQQAVITDPVTYNDVKNR